MKQLFQQKEIEGKNVLQNQMWRTTPEKAIQYAKERIEHAKLLVKEYPNPQPTEFHPIAHKQQLPKNLREMIIGLCYGQAIGDCIGIRGEGRTKKEVEYLYTNKNIELDNCCITEETVRFMNEEYKLDDWTDDTDQMLLILDSIVHNNGSIDMNDLAQRFYYWGQFGFSELGDLCALGYGSTFYKTVLSNNEFVNNPIQSTQQLMDAGFMSRSTDGSVMRTSIVAVPYFWDEEKVVENARNCGIITHPTLECQASVTITVLILSKLLQGRTDIENIILESYEKGMNDLKGNQQSIEKLKKHIFITSLSELVLEKDMSQTFKPMACAIFALRRSSQLKELGMEKKLIFRACMTEIIMEGGDADTNCAVAGAVIGCYLHCDCIPDEWMNLKNMNWYKQRINGILKLYELDPIEI